MTETNNSLLDDCGKQEVFWQIFYEKAWQFRSTFLRDCLKEGLSPYQSIKRLVAKERKYTLIYENDECVWMPKFQKEHENMIGSSGTPLLRKSSLLGHFIDIPFYSYDNINNFIIDIIDETGPYDSIIELGCGYGRNIFELFYAGGPTDTPFFGGEFTQSGVQIATELAAATPGMKSTFFHFNHLEPKLDFEFGEHALFFTVHSIEQVAEIPLKWFSVVANTAKRVTCIHIEPFGFQMRSLGPASEAHRAFFQEKRWNTNFANVLWKAANNQTIHLESCYTEISFPSDPLNPSSLAIWHSEKK